MPIKSEFHFTGALKKSAMAMLFGAALMMCFAGCGSKKPYSPRYPAARSSAKRLPPGAKVPPTQKPYRINGHTYYPIPSAYGYTETGIASWYGPNFHGKKTSNGETYDMHAATAAHKTLPMNTRLLVENLENGKKTVVRVNDRGPFVKKRIIDLSNAAAKAIGMTKKGTARVRITALGEAETTVRGGRKIEKFLPYQDFTAGEFYVQIGAFTNKRNADRLKNEMLRAGKKAVSQPYHTGSVTFYRVQVRAGRHLEQAHRLEKELESRFPGAFVIAR